MKPTTLTDRERILTYLVCRLLSTAVLCRGASVHSPDGWNDKVHFAFYRKPEPGDLVVGQTGYARGVHEWSIGWFVTAIADGAVIREIGSERLCNYTNEEFIPIVGIDRSRLLEGEKFLFQEKVEMAFARGDEYAYRFGGVDFTGKGTAQIWIREVFGGHNGDSKPFAVEVRFTPKMSVGKILKAMRAGGYGTRKFDTKEVGAA